MSFTTPNNSRTYVSKSDDTVSCIANPNLCSCIRPLGNRSCKHMRELQHLLGKKRSGHKTDYSQLKQLHSKSNEHQFTSTVKMSLECKQYKNETGFKTSYLLPEQFLPSPVKPLRHRHRQDPSVLVHKALRSQSFEVVHSSRSKLVIVLFN